MEWATTLSIIVIALLFLFSLGVPIAVAFFAVNIIALYFVAGGPQVLGLLTSGTFTSVTAYTLIAVPLFMLMGEILFRSGFVSLISDALDKLMGRLPGRFSVLTIGTGTVLATLSGTSLATTATLGTTILPEMVRRGYRRWLAYGSVVGGGALAVLIPPSGLAIILASLANLSPSKVLIGGALPGFLIASSYATFIIGICWIRPGLAPSLMTDRIDVTTKDKLITMVRALPLTLIVFLVTVVIFLGIATPTEAAGLGALGAFALALFYRKLGWQITKMACINTAKTTGTVFLIIAGANTFSQVLSLTGTARGLVMSVAELPMPPLYIIMGMLGIILIMGCLLDGISIMMITVPLYFPVVIALGYDPIWFAILMLISTELSGISPPVGLMLFALKSVYPPATMSDLYRAAIPFFTIQVAVIALIIAFPTLALWLPSVMR